MRGSAALLLLLVAASSAALAAGQEVPLPDLPPPPTTKAEPPPLPEAPPVPEAPKVGEPQKLAEPPKAEEPPKAAEPLKPAEPPKAEEPPKAAEQLKAAEQPKAEEPPPPVPLEPAPKAMPAFFAAVRLGLLVPAGKPAGVFADPDLSVPLGHRFSTIPVSLQLGYRLPWLSRALSVVAEGGYYPISSTGTRAVPQDPDFGRIDYAYSGRQFPLLIGLEAALPIQIPLPVLERLSFHAGASFAAVYARYITTYAAESVMDAPASGWALGAAVTGGAAFALGPGAILAEVRWTDARTDLQLRGLFPSQPFNASKADVVGMSYLAGYRLSF
jgi:hypothetical protein